MSKRDPKVTLLQILEHCQRLQELCSSYSPSDLFEDWKLAAALEREIQVLGETVRRLPSEITSSHPEIPWKQIVGTRDRLSHGYDETDCAVLWDAAKNGIPSLIAAAEKMLADQQRAPTQRRDQIEQDFRLEEKALAICQGPPGEDWLAAVTSRSVSLDDLPQRWQKYPQGPKGLELRVRAR